MNTKIIKGRISVLDALHQYGMKPNSRGFMLCPFHDEKTPSFKVYADGTRWKCFGCNRGGSVIDLVMELFEVDFKQAADRICIDFGLTATDQKADRLSLSTRQKQREEKQQELFRYRAEYMENVNAYRQANEIINHPRPKPDDAAADKIAQDIARAYALINHLDYYFEHNHWQ